MDTTIPYHDGMLLGRSVNLKTIQPGYILKEKAILPKEQKIGRTISYFSFATKLKDVCDVLSIPPEYALKVKAGIKDAQNELVQECLKDLGKEDRFKVIFRVTYIEKIQCLPPDVVSGDSSFVHENVKTEETQHTTESLIAEAAANSESSVHDGDSSFPGSLIGNSQAHENVKTEETHHTTESLIAEAAANSESSVHDGDSSFPGSLIGKSQAHENVITEETHHTTESLNAEAAANSKSSVHDRDSLLPRSLTGKSQRHPGTHWVKAIVVGNELFTVLTVSCKDSDKFEEVRDKIFKCLQGYRGQLDRTKIEALGKIDKKLSKKMYADVCLDIQYASFANLDKYPASLSGMVKTLDSFMDKCAGWTERSKHNQEYEVKACVMKCKSGIDKEEKATVIDSLKQMLPKWSAFSKEQTSAYPKKETFKKNAEPDPNGDLDSFLVLDSVTPVFYNMRITLQSFKKDMHRCKGLAVSHYPTTTTYTIFEKLFSQLVNSLEALPTVMNFMSSKYCFLEIHVQEGNKILKSIQNAYSRVLDTVADLDFVCIPTENTFEDVINKNPLTAVNDFIENVTSKLPPGSDIDLLMIGKTGHGKSATGNSILGRDEFLSSADASSVTSQSGVGWAEVDSRTIKVADTPGVCDTKLDNEESINFAMNTISKAIAFCPEGFHALLLFIRFGSRMTSEERTAIELLKNLLGEDIIKSYCIFVITYGDNFETEMAGTKTTFEDWCKKQDGFLKKYFEECNYRCVLFNNKATDPKVKKAQLIKLVSKVDSLKDSGTRYTNSLFEGALRERERIITENMVSEEMFKEMQLIRQSLDSIINSDDENAVFSQELSRLKKKCDNLESKITAIENAELVASVTSLSKSIRAKIDKVNATPKDVSQKRGGNSVEDEDLKANRDTFCKHIDTVNAKHHENTQQVANQVVTEIKIQTGCFPGSSFVMLPDGKYVTLEELCVGDKVLVRDKTGCLRFDTVYMFGHQELEASSEFLALKTASHTVYVTRGHFVYCMKNGTELCVSAENVHVGDCLLVATEDGFVPQTVQAVTYERKRGLFAPFTNSGNIVIDGALMSCYIDVLPATTCHTLLWPVRQLYRVSPRLLSYINGPSPKHPIPRWAKAAMKLM